MTLVLDDVHLLTAPRVLDGLAYVLQARRAGAAAGGLLAHGPAAAAAPVPADRGPDRDPGRRPRLHRSRSPACSWRSTASRCRAGSLERLTRRAEGWAAIMRLAAISMDGHADPDQFVKELIAEDSAVAGYPGGGGPECPARRSPELPAAYQHPRPDQRGPRRARWSGTDRDAAVLPDLVRANALVQRDDGGWYRYHSLFAAVLRLKLRREHPDELPGPASAGGPLVPAQRAPGRGGPARGQRG